MREDLSRAKMHKAISVIQFKLEGQTIMRNKDFEMEDRLLLNAIDYKKGTVKIDGKEYELTDKEFPTINPENPYELSEEECEVMEKLVFSFKQSEKLQKHIEFLYTNGSFYKICNGNLLFHGCIPTEENGEFSKVKIGGKILAGKELMDESDILVRKAYYSYENFESKQKGMDFIWYLWCGKKSSLFGKNRMTTFERYFVADKSTWTEEKDYYYKYANDVEYCNKILREFGLDENKGHIINGHVPVKTKDGENPIKAKGKLIVIDGGICKAYRKTTGRAGYTLIYNSKKMRIVSHNAIDTICELVKDNTVTIPEETIVSINETSMKVGDTDIGANIRQTVKDLETLLGEYYSGTMNTNKPSVEHAIIKLTEKYL